MGGKEERGTGERGECRDREQWGKISGRAPRGPPGGPIYSTVSRTTMPGVNGTLLFGTLLGHRLSSIPAGNQNVRMAPWPVSWKCVTRRRPWKSVFSKRDVRFRRYKSIIGIRDRGERRGTVDSTRPGRPSAHYIKTLRARAIRARLFCNRECSLRNLTR